MAMTNWSQTIPSHDRDAPWIPRVVTTQKMSAVLFSYIFEGLRTPVGETTFGVRVPLRRCLIQTTTHAP